MPAMRDWERLVRDARASGHWVARGPSQFDEAMICKLLVAALVSRRGRGTPVCKDALAEALEDCASAAPSSILPALHLGTLDLGLPAAAADMLVERLPSAPGGPVRYASALGGGEASELLACMTRNDPAARAWAEDVAISVDLCDA